MSTQNTYFYRDVRKIFIFAQDKTGIQINIVFYFYVKCVVDTH